MSLSSSSSPSSPSPSSKGIPFSWEEEPGISKSGSPETLQGDEEFTGLELSPPPFQPGSPRRLSARGPYVPLPPCLFQPSAMSGSEHQRKRGQRWIQDPFLAAYMECTKSGKESEEKRRGGLSCKYAGGVREDAIVRLSHIRALRPRDF